MVIALNDTLYFGLLFSTESQGGLVVTVALGGIETPSGLALAKRPVWCSIWLIGTLQSPHCIRAG